MARKNPSKKSPPAAPNRIITAQAESKAVPAANESLSVRPAKPDRLPLWVQFAILAALVAATYGHTLDVPYYLDDITDIPGNGYIHDLSNLKKILEFSTARFVGYLTFALNYHFHGTDLAGYHLVNIFIHWLAGVAVFLLARELLSLAAVRNAHPLLSARLPFLAAAIFLLHPLQTQAVTYIVQRVASLGAFFYLAALASYLKARRQPNYRDTTVWGMVTVLFGVLAMFTKQNTYSLPLALLATELLFLAEKPKRLLLICGAAGFAGVTILISISSLRLAPALSLAKLDAMTRETDFFTRPQYLALQVKALWHYLRLFLWPTGLRLDYGLPSLRGFADPIVLAAAAGHVAAIVAAVAGRKRFPLLTGGIVFYYLAQLVESSVAPIRDPLFEHRTYLPNAGLAWSAAFLLLSIPATGRLRAARKPLIILPVIILGLLTFQRNSLWRDQIAFLEDNMAKSPDNPRVYNNAGVVAKKNGQLDKAIRYFQKAIELDPLFAHAQNNLGNAFIAQGAISSAMPHVNKALELDPELPEAHQNLGRALSELHRFDEAIERYRQAISLRPDYAEAYNDLGLALQKTGNTTAAAESFQAALDINPNLVCALNNLGLIMKEKGRTEEAASYFSHSLKIVDSFEANYNLGMIFMDRNECDPAIDYFSRSIEINGNFASSYLQRGICLAVLGRDDQAIVNFNMALQINPDFSEARYNLDILLNRTNR